MQSEAPADARAGTGQSPVAELVGEVAELAGASGRDDLAPRLADAATRIGRGETVVCVVGEFKQGKSALINALLGTDVCPVDDDLATMAVTVVRHGPTPGASIRHRGPDGIAVEAIGPAELADWVTERGNPDNRLKVEIAEVVLPNPVLAAGLTLVDTPGVGGLNAAHAAATLAFLPLADALVFVTDASAELTAAELEFLGRAAGAGPPILVALTKIDMYPAWRKILEIDQRRLAEAGLGAAIYPVSSVLRPFGSESGFEPFEQALLGEVAEGARREGERHALLEAQAVIDQLREPLAAELEALDGPESARRLGEELEGVRARLDRLGEGGAHWSARLEDEFETLRVETEFAFHTALRRIVREAHEEIERIDPGRAWPEFSQRLQQEIASAVRTAFAATTGGAARVQTIVAGLIADEEISLPGSADPVEFDPTELWQGGQSFGGLLQSTAGAGAGMLGGATVGVEMLGMLGALLGTALVGPALLGAALLFGGREVVAQRRRQLTDRRQQARTFVSEFVENVQFETDGRLASLGRELQRQMRAGFSERIGELRRTWEQTAAAIERAGEQQAADAAVRRPEIRNQLEELEGLAARGRALEAGS